jgi:hypothetical protein
MPAKRTPATKSAATKSAAAKTTARKAAAKKTAAKKSAKAAKKPRVRVRTYRHGLGDCHLVTFRRPGATPFHVLIDFGVVNRTRDPETVMTPVARDIAKECGGVLDLVIATHQHTDHLSGFKQAAAELAPAKLTMKRLWLAWTEDPGNDLGKQIQDELVKKLAAVRLAVRELVDAGSPAAARIQGTLDFFSPGVAGEDTQEILDALQARDGIEVDYHQPGDLLQLPGVPGVRVYVLGPPSDPAALKVTNPRKTKHEGYELAADAAGFVDALGVTGDADDEERSQPFAPRHRRPEAEMARDEFFQRHYFGDGADPDDRRDLARRKIDTSWLEAAEQLALALGDYTNNTSLALAFELEDTGEVLLFPGDAQIGSWNSWPKLEWTVTEHGTTRTVRIGDLLKRTVFYKASHHASHNGTLSGRAENAFGLEQMTHRDLVCVVPVDLKMSKAMNWDRTLPWQPLLTRLGEMTRGRLILTDRAAEPPLASKLALLSPAERKRFAKALTVTDEYVDYTR